MQQEMGDDEKEGNEPERGGPSEIYEHIKDAEKFDDFTFDAATEEQIKKQASNLIEGTFQTVINIFIDRSCKYIQSGFGQG